MIGDQVSRTADGRPVLMGCRMLPPVDDQQPPQDAKTTSTGKTKGKRKKTAGDRFAMLNRFVDLTMRDLTPSETLVWFVLYRDTKDGLAKSSQAYIAERSGLTQSTVSLAVKRLNERGLLKIVKQGGFRKGLSVYRIQGSTGQIP